MVDITMCVGSNCPLNTTCYRCHAPANDHWQSISDFTKQVVVINGVAECPEYIFYRKNDNGTENLKQESAPI